MTQNSKNVKQKKFEFKEFWFFKYYLRWLFLLAVLVFTYGFLFKDFYWSFFVGEGLVRRVSNVCVYSGGSYALLRMGEWI